jgi:hypothetical protein
VRPLPRCVGVRLLPSRTEPVAVFRVCGGGCHLWLQLLHPLDYACSRQLRMLGGSWLARLWPQASIPGLALHLAADAALGRPSMVSAALADPVGVSSVRFLLNRRQHITCEPASRAEECCSQPEPAPAMWAQPYSSRVGSNGCL